MTDTIADMLTRIRNALIAKHDSVEIPASTMKKAIAQILVEEGYIKSFEVIADGEKKTSVFSSNTARTSSALSSASSASPAPAFAFTRVRTKCPRSLVASASRLFPPRAA